MFPNSSPMRYLHCPPRFAVRPLISQIQFFPQFGNRPTLTPASLVLCIRLGSRSDIIFIFNSLKKRLLEHIRISVALYAVIGGNPSFRAYCSSLQRIRRYRTGSAIMLLSGRVIQLRSVYDIMHITQKVQSIALSYSFTTKRAPSRVLSLRVGTGARTLDLQIHNLAR